jgi:hypothetical protein
MAFWKRKKSDAAQQADSGRQPALQYSDLGITHPYTTPPKPMLIFIGKVWSKRPSLIS